MARSLKHGSDIIVNSFEVCGLTNNLDRSEDEQLTIFKDKKCCAGRLKEFDSKNPAVNIEDAGHDQEMNQDVNDFDFDEDFYIIIEEKDS